jgi:hypothetical protein
MIFTATKREIFALGCLRYLGDVVVWGGLDCSDLVARGEMLAGLPDRRGSHTAQLYSTLNPTEAEKPKLGDLGFFGHSWAQVQHVVVSSFGGQVLSADGATQVIKDPAVAITKANARVKLHPDTLWYRSAGFLGWRDHHELDT